MMVLIASTTDTASRAIKVILTGALVVASLFLTDGV